MKELEAQRRETLRSFLVEANAAIGDCWDTLPTLCKASSESANALDASQASVDAEVTVMAARGAEEKVGFFLHAGVLACLAFFYLLSFLLSSYSTFNDDNHWALQNFDLDLLCSRAKSQIVIVVIESIVFIYLSNLICLLACASSWCG